MRLRCNRATPDGHHGVLSRLYSAHHEKGSGPHSPDFQHRPARRRGRDRGATLSLRRRGSTRLSLRGAALSRSLSLSWRDERRRRLRRWRFDNCIAKVRICRADPKIWRLGRFCDHRAISGESTPLSHGGRSTVCTTCSVAMVCHPNQSTSLWPNSYVQI